METLLIALIILYLAYKCNTYKRKKNNFKNRYKDEDL